jgi:hypothetical protein
MSAALAVAGKSAALMDQSSQDNTIAGVRSPRLSSWDAVPFQSSQDKDRKRSREKTSYERR